MSNCLRFATPAEANRRPEAWRDTLRTSKGRTSDAEVCIRNDGPRMSNIEVRKLAISMPVSSKRESFELPERLLDPPGNSLGHVDRFKDAFGVLWRPGDAPGSPE